MAGFNPKRKQRQKLRIQAAINTILEPFIAQENDDFPTLALMKSYVDRYLDSLLANLTIRDYTTICDSTNNPPVSPKFHEQEIVMDIKILPYNRRKKAIQFKIIMPLLPPIRFIG